MYKTNTFFMQVHGKSQQTTRKENYNGIATLTLVHYNFGLFIIYMTYYEKVIL